MNIFRKLTTLTSDDKKILLENYGYHTINDAKKIDYKNMNADVIYNKLKMRFNTEIEQVNNTLQKINQNKQKQKQKRLETNLNKIKKQEQATLNLAKTKVINEIQREIKRGDRQYKDEYNAFKGAFQQVNFKLADCNQQDLKALTLDTLLNKLSSKPSDRNLQVSARVLYDKTKDNTEIIFHQVFSSDYAVIIRNPKNVIDFTHNFIETLINHIAEHENGPSNMKFKAFTGLQIQFTYKNLSKVGSYIELPKVLQDKKCCVNIKNLDDKCLAWCYLAFRHYEDVGKKENKYLPKGYDKWLNEFEGNMKVEYPIHLGKDLSKIEEALNLKINVFEYEGKPFVLYNDNTRQVDEKDILDLLLLRHESIQHFVWIKNFSRFIRKENDTHKCYYCRNCLNFYTKDKNLLEQHTKNCVENEAVRAVLPNEDEKHMRFKNFNNTFQHPFHIIYDFESTLEKINEKSENGETKKYQKHIPNSYGMKFNCIYPEFDKPRIIRNSADPKLLMKHFIQDLELFTKYAYRLTQRSKIFNFKTGWTADQRNRHNLNISCNSCHCEYSEENKKVVHHDHITGFYLDTICNSCNLKFQQRRFIPIIAHNSKNYDSHFIVPYLYTYGEVNDSISCIPNNEEKYISFSKKIIVDSFTNKENEVKNMTFEMRFIDSFSFLSTSIEKLVDNLKVGCKTIQDKRNLFLHMSNHYTNDEEFDLMLQKGIYPYDYIDKFSLLLEEKLPSQKEFYNQLNDCEVNEKDYKDAQEVFTKMKCKNLLDYHNQYLTCDVLLLSDIWVNFCRTSYSIYQLDPNYYLTSPSLSWDAVLKFCYDKYGKKWSIELLMDYDMYLMFERGIRGGLSQISLRYAKANNKYSKHYNPNENEGYIMYFDANNLYGCGMSSFLPYKGFQWNTEEWTKEKILSLPDDGEKGYLFEVDLHYPSDLHKLHNGYALCSENQIITNDMLNTFQAKDRKETKIRKLVCSFVDKKDYVLNYRYLKQALELGLELIKVHRVIEYNQLDFMAEYIQKNTHERAKAKSDFEKDFYKLMNNSVYGKTMENVRNRINFKLLASEKDLLGLRNIPRSFTYFNENLVGAHLLKKEVKLNKPIFIGQNVLDQSKIVMYDFYYNFIMKKFNPDNVKLLMTDTDSLVLYIQHENPYEKMLQNKEYFDLSEYPKDSPYYDATNKKVIGKFKDEVGLNCIHEFCGLRPKLYAYTVEDSDEEKKCKGVKKSVVEKVLTFEKYNEIRPLEDRKIIEEKGFIEQNIIRSYQHHLYTETVTKLALSPNDDKVYICDDKINTFTFGSCFIPSLK